ncbi:zinc transporter ZIP9 isoform X3 [Embiotoca jacksoni]|uniref:zinc transporter ZIP9 isoform X3 n=1 Tax=Embiotoca jacksoni TaxID=100190 RepID=UPI003703BA9D
MDGGLTITFISVAMFVGSFLLGFIPLLFRLSEKSLQFVSILGAGLLCGTALAITIPEGVGLLEETRLEGEQQASSSSSSHVPSGLNASAENATSTEGGLPPRFFIGVSLTFGFIFMFVVDQIGSYLSMRDQTSRLPNSVHLTATLGLVIHAAGACGVWSGLLPDACGPGEEVRPGTFTGLLSCSTDSRDHHLLHITCIWQLLSEADQCDRRGNALLGWDFPVRGHGARSPRDQQQDRPTGLRPPAAHGNRDPAAAAAAATTPGTPGEPHAHPRCGASNGAGSWVA